MSSPNSDLITFRCQCGTLHSVSREHAGRRAQCAACGKKLHVPTVVDSPRRSAVWRMVHTVLNSTPLTLLLMGSLVAVAGFVAGVSWLMNRDRSDTQPNANAKQKSVLPQVESPGRSVLPVDEIVDEEWTDNEFMGQGFKHRGFGKLINGKKANVWVTQSRASKKNLITNQNIPEDHWSQGEYLTAEYSDGEKEGCTILWNAQREARFFFQYSRGRKNGVLWLLPSVEFPNGIITLFKDGVPGDVLSPTVLTASQRQTFDQLAKLHDRRVNEFVASKPLYRSWLP